MANIGSEFIRKCQWDELDVYYTKCSVKFFLSYVNFFFCFWVLSNRVQIECNFYAIMHIMKTIIVLKRLPRYLTFYDFMQKYSDPKSSKVNFKIHTNITLQPLGKK